MTCRTISQIASFELDRALGVLEWLLLHSHLPLCSGCRRFRHQLLLLRAWTRDERLPPREWRLSSSARERMKRAVRAAR